MLQWDYLKQTAFVVFLMLPRNNLYRILVKIKTIIFK